MLAYQGKGVLKGEVVPTVHELCQVLMGEHSSSCNDSDSRLHVNFPKIQRPPQNSRCQVNMKQVR